MGDRSDLLGAGGDIHQGTPHQPQPAAGRGLVDHADARPGGSPGTRSRSHSTDPKTAFFGVFARLKAHGHVLVADRLAALEHQRQPGALEPQSVGMYMWYPPAGVVLRDAVAHRAADQPLAGHVGLEVNARRRGRARGVRQHATLDQQVLGGDDADSLAVVLVANDITDVDVSCWARRGRRRPGRCRRRRFRPSVSP